MTGACRGINRGRDDRDGAPAVVEQRVLNPADGRVGAGRVMPADHDQFQEWTATSMAPRNAASSQRCPVPLRL